MEPVETGRHEADKRPLSGGAFPAFVLAQCALCERNGQTELDIIGYFRKQEMLYWWPVNVAELAELQQAVLAKLGEERSAVAGRIVTFSATALAGSKLPGVAVIGLDRAIEEGNSLWEMAASIAFPDATDSQAAKTKWSEMIEELRGTDRAAPPVPKVGHSLLLSHLEMFGKITESEGLVQVTNHFKRLCEYYSFADGAKSVSEGAVPALLRSISALEAAVGQVLDGPAAANGAHPEGVVQ